MDHPEANNAYKIVVSAREGNREFVHGTRGTASSAPEMYLDASVGLGVVCNQSFPRPLTALAQAIQVVADIGSEERNLSAAMQRACDQLVMAASNLVDSAAEYDSDRAAAEHAAHTAAHLRRLLEGRG